MSATINYEHESDSGTSYTFEIEYEAHAAEKETPRSYSSGGEPGWPAYAEVYGVTCKEMHDEDGEPSCFAGQQKEISDWFRNLIDTDMKLRERINELCLEDAGERDLAAMEEAADAKREAMRERGWR